MNGLIERRVIEQTAEYVVIREVWDTTVPGCPIVVLQPAPPEVDPKRVLVQHVTKTPPTSRE